MSDNDTAWIDLVAPRHLRGLDVYQPGKPVEELEREYGVTGALKVASNENPLGPAPRALAAAHAALASSHLYPDASGFALRTALGARLGVDPAQIILGGGSNELLYQLVTAFCDPDDEVVSHEYAFLSYRLAAQTAARPFVAARATADRRCDVDALIAAFTPRTKLVLLGTPNNPTGSVVTKAEMERIAAALPARALLVIDEAYGEYAAAWPEIDHARGADWLHAPRVMVLRTFSKIYGLAGLRVGYGVGHPALIELAGRVGRTFNVSAVAQAAALAALDDTDHVAKSAALARSAIERLTREVSGPGITVYPSLANFALIETGRPGKPIYEALLRRGVIVRPMAAWGLPTCIRVSVAAAEQMDRVIAALRAVLGPT
ncbi:MAG: histidinol-phosphate transaminase [Deltaproteobacteria bacterium]|nr:histidinol-phosphate transaminase [Deltaproteobacteria bacterium]